MKPWAQSVHSGGPAKPPTQVHEPSPCGPSLQKAFAPQAHGLHCGPQVPSGQPHASSTSPSQSLSSRSHFSASPGATAAVCSAPGGHWAISSQSGVPSLSLSRFGSAQSAPPGFADGGASSAQPSPTQSSPGPFAGFSVSTASPVVWKLFLPSMSPLS